MQEKQTKEHVSENEVIGEMLPWGRMIGLHGGSEQIALDALERGEIREVRNPRAHVDGVKTLFVSVAIKGLL